MKDKQSIALELLNEVNQDIIDNADLDQPNIINPVTSHKIADFFDGYKIYTKPDKKKSEIIHSLSELKHLTTSINFLLDKTISKITE